MLALRMIDCESLAYSSCKFVMTSDGLAGQPVQPTPARVLLFTVRNLDYVCVCSLAFSLLLRWVSVVVELEAAPGSIVMFCHWLLDTMAEVVIGFHRLFRWPR